MAVPPTDPRFVRATALVHSFSQKSSPGAFTKLHRDQIAKELHLRIADPTVIDQGKGGLCPSASVAYSIANTDPERYVKCVTELFDIGSTKIADWSLEPCSDLKNYALPSDSRIAEADWIIMASMRDSENWFIDYQSVSDEGGAWGREVALWLKKAGFTDIHSDWNYVFDKPATNLCEADRLYSKGYQVCLLIDSDPLLGETSRISQPDHWVVLASNVSTNFAKGSSSVNMTVYSWGKKLSLPLTPMTLDDFTDYYYGYVAGKF
jgi:hypothetical protein